MSDKLKDFIGKNREAFDANEPQPQLFNRIHKQMTGKGKTKKMFYKPLRFAAAAVMLIVISGTVYTIVNKKKGGDDSVVKTTQPVLEEATLIGDPAFAKQIVYFREMIGLQQSELKQLEKEYPQLYNQFVGDITELDSSYQALKTNLSANPNREMLLEAMIQNLQLQSELLNRQLLIIKEIKQKSKTNEMSNKNYRAT
ncbi:hypothetical protein CAP36_02995 [Chitinophagaceae bacterium IBVUCB2]|nr:hypothetical protein CAP36_02995 [Chitinophagaceae bacterium IBVUCB2]